MKGTIIFLSIFDNFEIDDRFPFVLPNDFNFYLFSLSFSKWPKSAKINRVTPFDSEFLELFFRILWAKRSKNSVFSENRHLRASNEKFSSIFTFFSIFEIFGKLRVFSQKSKKWPKSFRKKFY